MHQPGSLVLLLPVAETDLQVLMGIRNLRLDGGYMVNVSGGLQHSFDDSHVGP